MNVSTIDRDELERMLPHARVVEATPRRAFRRSHLPGAVNIPPDQVEQLAPRLLPRRDELVVVYGEDAEHPPHDVSARLVELGYTDVRELRDGKDAWVDAGMPVESGEPPTPPDPDSESHEDWLVDVASWESFPASDPPAHSPLRP